MLNCWTRKNETEIAKCQITDITDMLDKHRFIMCDLETTGLSALDNEIMSIQLGTEQEQYLIEWSVEAIPILKKYFLSDRVFLFQNSKFDLRFLLKHELIINNVYDTFLVEKIIRNDGDKFRKNSLDALCLRYLDITLDKSIRKNIPELGLIPEVISYALDDVKYLMKIAKAQKVLIDQWDLAETVKLENKFVKVLTYIEHCGIKLDTVKWLKTYEENMSAMEKAREDLTSMALEMGISVGRDIFTGDIVCQINWDSSDQVIPLMKNLGVDVVVDRKGKVGESIDARNVLAKYKSIPFVQAFLNYKEYSHFTATFGKDYLRHVNSKTGRIHTNFTQLKDTGRLSCGSEGETDKTGTPNLQQVPREDDFRHCFVPEDGYSFICCDYSSQEGVVFASRCLDTNLLKFYDDNLGDIHSYTASLCFSHLLGISLEEIKNKYKEERQGAKAAGFAIQYGGNGYSIANNLGIELEKGEEIFTKYMEAYPEIPNYFAKISSESLTNGYITYDDVVKRKYFFRDLEEFKKLEAEVKQINWTDYKVQKKNNTVKYQTILKPLVSSYYRKLGQYKRLSYNYPIQGTSSSMTKLACIYLYDWILSNNLLFIVKIVNVIHDEIVVEAPQNMIETISIKVQEYMENAADVFCKRLKIKAVPMISNVWSH